TPLLVKPPNSGEQPSKPAGTSVIPSTVVEAKTNVLSQSSVEIPPSAPKASFPSVRLQGIFYNPTHPSALINAKTLFLGDKVAGAKVIAITAETVTLQWNGETKVLSLE